MAIYQCVRCGLTIQARPDEKEKACPRCGYVQRVPDFRGGAPVSGETGRKKNGKLPLIIAAAALVAAGVIIGAVLPKGQKSAPQAAPAAYEGPKESAVDAGGLSVGDTFIYGMYIQLNEEEHSADCVQPIEWVVLDIQNGKMLLQSRLVLEVVPYNDTETDVTWETCSLRRWLNEDFYNTAFSAGEKDNILVTEVPPDPNPRFSTAPGNYTRDRIFILSLSETKRYYPSSADWWDLPTDYVSHKNAAIAGVSTPWFRTPGMSQSRALSLMGDESYEPFFEGTEVSHSFCGVRPAFWVRTAE